jgi:hypothetical protein
MKSRAKSSAKLKTLFAVIALSEYVSCTSARPLLKAYVIAGVTSANLCFENETQRHIYMLVVSVVCPKTSNCHHFFSFFFYKLHECMMGKLLIGDVDYVLDMIIIFVISVFFLQIST